MVCGGLFFREVVIICAEPTALLALVVSFVANGLKSILIDMGQAYGFLQSLHNLMNTPPIKQASCLFWRAQTY
jgi:hypothetical protein